MADIKSYMAVTFAYWAFTLTDGALRMLILLYFHTLGYSPLQLATLFLLYELMGIPTNLVGGWTASQFGLRLTLFIGLSTQIFALMGLSALEPDWSQQVSVIFVLCMQGLSGIAKDLSKMSSKSALKLVVPEDSHSTLFRWVALLTGSKNALKGAGFFLGGLLLAHVEFQGALWLMATSLSIVLIVTIFILPKNIGGDLAKTSFSEILSKSPEINWLSIARALLFGSRDIWFVVGLPVFLYEVLKWSFETVGAFFACWIVGYGFIQSATPRIVRRTGTAVLKEVASTQILTFVLCLMTATLAVAIYINLNPLICVIVGLGLFGAIFAVNSSLHSYLILALTETDQVTLNVGFYYMANAVGRFAGTLLSGIVYQLNGLFGCLLVASIMIGLSGLCVTLLGHTFKTKQTN